MTTLSNTKYDFFGTRTIAREVAKERNTSVKDFGKDAPKGERWGVLAIEIQETETEQREILTLHKSTSAKPSIARLAKTLYLNTNKRVIPVHYKHRKLTVNERLALAMM